MLNKISDYIKKITRAAKFQLGDNLVQWKKVAELTPGIKIAVTKGNDHLGGERGEISWDEIVSITKLPAEQVWDIEVEGTHNFVANGIVAHNTTGKALAIFNETGDQNILVASASGVTKFTLDRSGNIGSATWNGSIIGPAYGGTGIANNAASTLAISGNFGTTLTISGTTSVTLPTSGTLYGTATGSITSNQLLTSLSDETGTGVAVFGTSPAITTSLTTGSTTFALLNTTATTVNFAGAATALNIGAATGTTTIANAASVSGALTLFGTPTIATTAKQSLTLGDSNTGNIIMSGGNVGIGTTGPADKLSVAGTAFLGGSTTGLNINAGTITSAYAPGQSGTNEIPIVINAIGASTTSLALQTGGTNRLTISAAGNTTVTGSASVSGALTLYGTPTIQATANQTLILGGTTTGWINFAPLNTSTLTIKPNLLALGTATIDGTGTLSLNTTNNQAITTGTGTFTVAGAATVSASLALGPQSTDATACNAANEGRVYYKGTTGFKRLYLCDGTTWIPISAGTLIGGDTITTLSPEYPSAVISADGSNNVGTFTSDREATGSGNLYNFNYYEFSSGQTSLQDYDIYVRYRIPENFSSWVTSNALTVDYETEDTAATNNKVDVTIYQDNSATTVSSTGNVSNYASAWHSSQTGGTPVSFTAAQLNTGLTWSAGSIMTIKIKLYSKDNYFARVGAIKFDWQ